MWLYAITVFLSAFLLFQVQPMIARMILPWFGGTAAVWATCLLFFQAVLLAGYGYTHGVVKRLRAERQWMLHVALLALALAVLPILPDPKWKPVSPEMPAARILALLAVTVGLPYFLLSTTAPLVQAWFARAFPDRSPYRLYALSNLGSMLALLSYPTLFEPAFTLRQQAWAWSGGFILFAILCAITGWSGLRRSAAPGLQPPADPAPAAPGAAMHALWAALAMGPSLLLLALTTHMTTDLAPIPFLWVLPLALYLLSFILCFDAPRWYRRTWFLAALPAALGALFWLVKLGPEARPDLRLMIAGYALCFFVACMVCHGELARLRPHPGHLTGYYLMISVGGALGGLFVAVLAPALFRAMYELPLGIALCGALAAVVLLRDAELPFRRDLLGWPSILLLTGVAVLWGFAGREIREMTRGALVIRRNFYGELRVRQYNGVYDWEGYRTLVHGTINHGEQYTHPARRREIATYYCEDTGLGLWMRTRPESSFQRVGVLGLGAGTIAAYSRFGDVYRFYELNPEVEKIARNYFWYLENAEGAVEVVLGDGRLSMEREPPQNYDLLVMDAFSSDSIPVHLLTREAIQLYFRHLKADGVLAVHISNRYVDLKPVLEREAALLGKAALLVETEDSDDGRCFGTTWVLMANRPEVFAREPYQKGAQPLEKAEWMRPWTDDYSNLFRVIK
ncbi:MAG: fused MFS/spermidine synthase [Bryobacteraceae bacterium]|nr:fused MFS/spermidine synthase [Bryobacteraceae bacterium]